MSFVPKTAVKNTTASVVNSEPATPSVDATAPSSDP